MSRGTPHIVDVSIPQLPLAVASALEGGEIGAVAEMAGLSFDIVISFGDGSVYRYPSVPASIAAGLKMDPEGTFPTIRYWPGYSRIR